MAKNRRFACEESIAPAAAVVLTEQRRSTRDDGRSPATTGQSCRALTNGSLPPNEG